MTGEESSWYSKEEEELESESSFLIALPTKRLQGRVIDRRNASLYNTRSEDGKTRIAAHK